MALSTYSDLQSAVADWANRTDLTARIPDFISLAESRINADLRLRTMETDEALTGVVASRFLPLSSGFLQPLALWWNNGAYREEVRFVPAAEMDASTAAGRPNYWTIDAGQIAFERPCDIAYSFTFRHTEALNLAASPNWLILNQPNLYLFGALVEVFSFLQDPAAGQGWEARYLQALGLAKALAGRARSLSTLSTDAALQLRGHRFDIRVD